MRGSIERTASVQSSSIVEACPEGETCPQGATYPQGRTQKIHNGFRRLHVAIPFLSTTNGTQKPFQEPSRGRARLSRCRSLGRLRWNLASRGQPRSETLSIRSLRRASTLIRHRPGSQSEVFEDQ